MLEKYLNKVSQWCFEDKDYGLVLSDDVDSLLTTAILNEVKGWKVQYFYDFEHTYKGNNAKNEPVWCDVAILGQQKSFDNHITRYSASDNKNENSVNPNLLNGVTAQNYSQKYCGSTALLVWSLYDLPLPSTELGKMVLLTIDSTFKGYYSGFKTQCVHYLRDMFGFDELIEVLERHTIDEFYNLVERFNLVSKIVCDADGNLSTELPLGALNDILERSMTMPRQQFEQCRTFKNSHKPVYYNLKNIKGIVTGAFVFKNKIQFSTILD